MGQVSVNGPNVTASPGNMGNDGERPLVKCQYCGKIGHIRRYCRKMMREQRAMSNAASLQSSNNYGTRSLVMVSNNVSNYNNRRDGPL